MPINANVSGGQQITASVGETKIDVSVSGGVGPSGASGAAGAAASITVGTVTTGAPGSSASVVNAGSSSAAVLNFTIPAGATGATGPQGPVGPAGTTTWAGITDKPSTFTPSSHQHVAADISDFTSAVIAAAPPTTNASLLTSGTLPDARLSANIARTSDVSSAVAAVVNAAPASLDTLKELADALGNDASFAATVTNSLALKAPLANPTFTGTVSGITKAMVGLGNVPNTDATARANHTGTQAISTVSGLQTALDAKASLAGAEFTGAVDVNGTFSANFADFFSILVNGQNTITSQVVSGSYRLLVDGQVVVLGNDARLSDARTPTAHTQAWSTITSTPTTLAGYGITDAVGSSDSRLSDARTPTAHKSTHATGGTDALTPADIGAASVSHTHSALDLTSGTLDIARLPVGQTSTTVAAGNDARFTDARTPLAHVHSGADITSGTVADARLSANARQAIDNLFHPFLLAGM